MALFVKRDFQDCYLDLKAEEDGKAITNHIFEPEFHQKLYRGACEDAAKTAGAFRLGDLSKLSRAPNRGIQPSYIDDENDPESLTYVGMLNKFGKTVTSNETSNVCALKSVAIRSGYVDFGVARAVSDKFYQRTANRASVQQNDLLINSTGDGTIGRVAVYNASFRSIVDGHITIVRFKDKDLPWYVAAYLMSEQGQRQIYRYINGSSGQVEIYPQDIERLWIPGASPRTIKNVADKFRNAVKKYDEFQHEMANTLSFFT